MSDETQGKNYEVFDLESLETNPNAEKNGVIFNFAGVDFQIAHHMNDSYRARYNDLLTENSHALRLDNEDSRTLKTRLQNVAMCDHLILKWGRAVRGQGGELAYRGEEIIWEADSKGKTSAAAKKKMVEFLSNPKLRIFREQMIIYSMDDAKYGVQPTEADAGN